MLYKRIGQELSHIAVEFGCSIVRVSLRSGARRKTLQIMIERIDGNPVTIVDCENTSRAFSVFLDVMDPIKEKYNLEVSSPGVDRPLINSTDFYKFVGKSVIIRLYCGGADGKLIKGMLESATERGITIRAWHENADEVVFLEYAEIDFASLDSGCRVR